MTKGRKLALALDIKSKNVVDSVENDHKFAIVLYKCNHLLVFF